MDKYHSINGESNFLPAFNKIDILKIKIQSSFKQAVFQALISLKNFNEACFF